MRIIHVNTIAGTTAVGQIVDLISTQAIARGHDVYVATGYGISKVDGVHNIRIGNKVDRYVHALCTRINDSHALHSLRATNIFIDEIIKINPDIIHLHNIHGYYLNMSLLISFLKKTNIPVIITLHDLWLLTGHCAYPTVTKCAKYITASCNECSQSAAYPKTYFDFSSRNIRIKQELFSDFNNLHLVVPSYWMSNIVHNSWLKNNPMYVINNGIDTDIFVKSDSPQQNLVLGVANVWTKEKGLDLFVKIREILPSEIEILLIGVTKNQQKNLPLGIRCIEYVTNRDLPNYYASAKATINMSSSEAFGLTIVESMSCSTPVISFNNSAPSELITKETGILIADGDVEAVVKAIINIRKEDYTDRCRAIAIENYDQKIMCRKYVNLYELKR